MCVYFIEAINTINTPVTSNSLVILDINDRALELPRWNLALEENVQLAITPPLELWQAEEGADEAYGRSATPDVSALSGEVPTRRVKHLTCEENHRNLCNVVCTSSDASGERSQSHGARFRDDGVCDGTQGSCVHEGDQDAKDCLCVVCAAVLGNRCANAEEDEESAVDGGAPKEDVTAAEGGTQGNGDDRCHKLETTIDEAELEGEVCLRKTLVLFVAGSARGLSDTYIHSGTLEKEGGLVGNQVTGKVLRCVDQAGDNCSSEIGALPEVEE